MLKLENRKVGSSIFVLVDGNIVGEIKILRFNNYRTDVGLSFPRKFEIQRGENLDDEQVKEFRIR